jgi:hypothetical protein
MADGRNAAVKLQLPLRDPAFDQACTRRKRLPRSVPAATVVVWKEMPVAPGSKMTRRVIPIPQWILILLQLRGSLREIAAALNNFLYFIGN